MRRRYLVGASIAALFLVVIAVTAVLRARTPRRVALRLPKTASPLPAPVKKLAELHQTLWTPRILSLEENGDWTRLDDELAGVAAKLPEVYRALDLAYLHARVKLENGDGDEAAAILDRYTTPGNRFRDLALFHRAVVAAENDDDATASRLRQTLIFEEPRSIYRDEAIEDELAFLAGSSDASGLGTFASRIYPNASTALRRELDSERVRFDIAAGRIAAGRARGLQLLRGSSSDDPAQKVFRALDRPDITGALPGQDLIFLGEAARDHRHFDRAVVLLEKARSLLPARRDELTFAVGRARFGEEKYALAQQTYLQGAAATRDMRQKATFLYHAARATQLLGDDARAERELTSAIAVPGRFPATATALTLRLRIRLLHKRFAEAEADLKQIVRLFPNDHAIVDASIALALAKLAVGENQGALRILGAIPVRLLDRYEPYEIAYWRGRSEEQRAGPAAIDHYMEVLRAPVATHFAYLARERLLQPQLQLMVRQRVKSVSARVTEALASGKIDQARHLQTEVVLLEPSAGNLGRLRDIYQQLVPYRRILTLSRRPFPALPWNRDRGTRGELLLALGLFDEAIDEIPRLYGLNPIDAALTQSEAFRLAAASKSSIYSIEVLMRSVPKDYLPELLPRLVQELLYPRYFYDTIQSDSARFAADPQLVLSIMREESRFNPRAKSVAAARGLLQFIITTAKDIGRQVGLVEMEPEDLYDPRIVIQLGAKYVGDLLKEFGGDRYRAAAAYNAGPKQTAVWSRHAPAMGDDYFLSTVSFDETKQYVRKVLNSYERYDEIYSGGPGGGLQIEP